MYIKNRRNSNKIKGFGSYKTLCLSESLVLRNRLLFIYHPLLVPAYLRIPIAINTRGFSIRFLFAKLRAKPRH
jgi:hypothetical protein